MESGIECGDRNAVVFRFLMSTLRLWFFVYLKTYDYNLTDDVDTLRVLWLEVGTSKVNFMGVKPSSIHWIPKRYSLLFYADNNITFLMLVFGKFYLSQQNEHSC